jgi:type III pantothenate kinase
MRTLTISIGNTSLFVGVFEGTTLTSSFRLAAADLSRLPRRVSGVIDSIAICSVVPAITPDVLRLARATWEIEPHVLTAAAALPFKIGYRAPARLGTDRIAAAWGARNLLPQRNLIIVDCGTATTVTALSRDGTLLGGAIFPGLSLWPQMLAGNTAQLPAVALRQPKYALGRSPEEGIVSGVFHGHVGAIRELTTRLKSEAFSRRAAVVIGTGGHAPLLRNSKVFDRLEPALALRGLQAFASSFID